MLLLGWGKGVSMRPLDLRSLTAEERVQLDTKIREKTLPVRLHQRYRIVLEASRGYVASGLAERVGCSLNTHWSVAKLKAYCLDRGLLPPITDEWVRRLLRREGVSFQHTKTWKQSPDPDFEVKKTASWTSTPRRPTAGR